MTNETREQEIWKQYPEFDFIEVSNLGRVRTKDHWVTYKNGRKQLYKGNVLKQYDNGCGYMLVHFNVNGKHHALLVSRMVAICFLPNPLNLPEVNHIDNDPTNNAVSNLEWCSHKYNVAYRERYGISAKEYTKVLRRPVIAVNLDSFEVFWFESQHEAARKIGVKQGNIDMVIKGKYYHKTAGGYWFCRADENAVERVRVKFGDEVAKKVEKLMNNIKNI